MPVTVYRVDDEPLLIATLTGEVTRETLLTMYERSAALFTEADTTLYRITDLRHIETSIGVALQALADARADIPGSVADPRIHGIILGNNRWARIASDTIGRVTGYEVPIFDAMGEARRYVKVHIERSKIG